GGDFLITKINSSDGSIIWNKYFVGTGRDIIRSVDRLSNGFVVAGYSSSNSSSGEDVFVAKFDNNGNISWANSYGGAYNERSRYDSVKATSDGGFIVTGYSRSFTNDNNWDGIILKLDQNGDKKWFKRYYNNNFIILMPIYQLSNGNF
ncbi:MAG: hypothetical protein H5U37_06090, partial [Caldisericia bacterium]|nr:hypothetical protein [Caldisericia bacterium]